MPDIPDLASVAALVGDPTRARMLTLLMDGRALTATELALEGGVTPPSASSHLARLTAAGLITIARQGRHRYFRIATPEVAASIEVLMGLAARGGPRTAHGAPRDPALRRARVCYDHLAGEAGVRLLDRMREAGIISGGDDGMEIGGRGERWCEDVGIDLGALRGARRRLCRPCLDWSERRPHLAGSLGAALLDRMLELRHVRRVAGARTLALSPRGESFIERLEVAS
ncbi:MAG: ArsR/SmtB family transcription factor [Gemmatimonadaceae bacterium]